ncbi:hypothetical protein [Leucobacter komagatae]|uniref:Uncharacterized protein n=1 Tax=Leucobacter komagatae TaxID=55969 RepID=A0A0D0IPU3_9MICO|nr:hypothetical protein [Leucobacter komagatae]KIP53037.1 hypothetical protein SD72_06015 [Leucobacter komagatae]
MCVHRVAFPEIARKLTLPADLSRYARPAAHNLGRVGALLAPLTIGIIADSFSVGLGLAALGIGYAIAALITFFFIRDKIYDPAQADTDDVQQQLAVETGTSPVRIPIRGERTARLQR